jgi:hypothetical protein
MQPWRGRGGDRSDTRNVEFSAWMGLAKNADPGGCLREVPLQQEGGIEGDSDSPWRAIPGPNACLRGIVRPIISRRECSMFQSGLWRPGGRSSPEFDENPVQRPTPSTPIPRGWCNRLPPHPSASAGILADPAQVGVIPPAGVSTVRADATVTHMSSSQANPSCGVVTPEITRKPMDCMPDATKGSEGVPPVEWV